MGGVFKKHRATYATEGARLWYDNANNRSARNATGAGRQAVKCPMVKALDGTEWNYIFATRGYAGTYAYQAELAGENMASFNYMTAYATADRLEDWHIEDWQINAIGSTSQGKACMFNEQVMQQTYTLNITNPSVDHYSLNTNPYWSENTYYYKDGNNYILLETIPEDWEENYGTYYIFVQASEITVYCIRFKRSVRFCDSSNWDTNSSTYPLGSVKEVLAYSYYLDEPIIIPPQGNHSLTIKFSPMEM